MPSYRKAIQWIANNDEPITIDLEIMSEQLTVVLVADLFNKAPEKVAQDVINRRIEDNK